MVNILSVTEDNENLFTKVRLQSIFKVLKDTRNPLANFKNVFTKNGFIFLKKEL